MKTRDICLLPIKDICESDAICFMWVADAFIPDAIETNKDGMMSVNYNEAHTWKIAQLEQEIKELKAKMN